MLTKKDLDAIDERIDKKSELKFKHYTGMILKKIDKVVEEKTESKFRKYTNMVFKKIDKVVEEKTESKFRKYTNIVVEKLDKISGELEDIREDQILARSKDEECDARLTKIEGHLNIVPA